MKRILIIDDEPELGEYLCRFLKRKGLEAFKAEDGEDGIRIYRKHSPDCVFLDYRLPKMDGIGVLKQIRQINPDAEVYFITGEHDVDFYKQLTSSGAKGCLTKPISAKDVLKILGM
ncbi:MAG: response regulator [Candidatus Omnitrophota bacterium]